MLECEIVKVGKQTVLKCAIPLEQDRLSDSQKNFIIASSGGFTDSGAKDPKGRPVRVNLTAMVKNPDYKNPEKTLL